MMMMSPISIIPSSLAKPDTNQLQQVESVVYVLQIGKHGRKTTHLFLSLSGGKGVCCYYQFDIIGDIS